MATLIKALSLSLLPSSDPMECYRATRSEGTCDHLLAPSWDEDMARARQETEEKDRTLSGAPPATLRALRIAEVVVRADLVALNISRGLGALASGQWADLVSDLGSEPSLFTDSAVFSALCRARNGIATLSSHNAAIAA